MAGKQRNAEFPLFIDQKYEATGEPANDYRDKRNEYLDELSQYITFETNEQPDGTITIYSLTARHHDGLLDAVGLEARRELFDALVGQDAANAVAVSQSAGYGVAHSSNLRLRFAGGNIRQEKAE